MAWCRCTLLHRDLVTESRVHGTDVVEAGEPPSVGPGQHSHGRWVLRRSYMSVVSGAVQTVTYRDTNGEDRDREGELRLARINHADKALIGSVLREHVDSRAFLRSYG